MSDRVVRAMTDDGAFRIIAARTTDTVGETTRRQQLRGKDAAQLSELVTASILYRETMAPTHRVQVILQSEESGARLIADSHPDGWARGMKQGSAADGIVKKGATLTLMRTMYDGSLHQGTVAVGDSLRISDAFTSYMDMSEQVHAVVGLSATVADVSHAAAVKAAGGFLVQVLPETPEKAGALAVLTQRLEDDFGDLEARLIKTDASPEHLVEEIFWGMPHTILDTSDVRFGCHCSLTRVLASLASLGRAEIQSLIDEGDALDMNCDYCGQPYRIPIEQLKGLLSAS